MKYVKWLVGSVVATVLFTIAAVAAPSTNAPIVKGLDASQWTLSLAGAGSTQTKGNSDSTFGGELSLGHTGTFILPLEAGVRQGFGYSSANSEKYSFSTRGFADFTVLKLGNLEFDGGANLGTGYGATRLNFTAGPEAVARLYVKKDVDVFARADYRFDLSSATAQNQIGYVFGVRVKF